MCSFWIMLQQKIADFCCWDAVYMTQRSCNYMYTFINPPAIAARQVEIAVEVKISQLPVLTTLNNTRQCFYKSKTVDTFWPVNVRTARKVWQCSTFKCNR